MHKLRYKSMFLFTCYINQDRDTATAETKTIGYVQTKAPHRTLFFLPMAIAAGNEPGGAISASLRGDSGVHPR
jgi:hypothetical protein